MAAFQHGEDFFLQLEAVDARLWSHPDVVGDIAAAVDTLHGRQRHEHALGVLPAAALVVKDARHLHHHILDADVLADGIDTLVEQAICHGGADHHDLAAFVEIQRIDAAPEIERHVFLDPEVLVGNTEDLAVAVLAFEGDVAVLHETLGGDQADARHLLLERVDVRLVQLDPAPRAHAVIRQAGIAGPDDADVQHVRAEVLVNAVLHAAAGA